MVFDRKNILLSILLVFFLVLPIQTEASHYDQKHLTLLAVQEAPDGTLTGSTADLYLEIIDGSGRVFLDTSPVTKIDTQISTRYAKEIACDYFDLECEHYDFIYTIRAESSIIGGPSAGAATAALTAITMLDLEYDENIAITGTINSGGIIGPVGGVKEKVIAAQNKEISKVLVSLGSIEMIFPSNSTGNGSQDINESYDNDFSYDNLSLELNEVTDLNDIVYELTSERLVSDDYTLEVDNEYNEIMQNLSKSLCDRSVELEKELRDLTDNNSEIWESIDVIKNNSLNSMELGDYYSTASFCFGLNVELNYNIFSINDPSLDLINEEVDMAYQDITILENSLENREIKTISDLQTMMVVKERINEMNNLLSKVNESVSEEDMLYYLAFAKERLYSALAWMHFFDMGGKSFTLNDNMLRDACYQKIAEGDERYQYAKLYLMGLEFEKIKEDLDLSISFLNKGDYVSCLSQASQAKGDASTILNSLGLNEDNFHSYLEAKVTAVEREIAENTAEGVFPILGYSYYQYAKTLESKDPYASLLYYEYALELSELDIYFPEEKEDNFLDSLTFNRRVGTFLNGFLQGIVIGGLFVWLLFQGVKMKRRIGK
jgi:uncharacterized protein